MPVLEIDTYLEMRYPLRIMPEDFDDSFNTYLSSVPIEGGYLPVSIVHPVCDDYSALAAAHTIAHVVGTLDIVDRGLFVSATSLVPVHTPREEERSVRIACYPAFLTFIGKVTRGHVSNGDRPGLVTIEVTVESKSTWPGTDTIVTCQFNGGTRVFRSLRRFVVGMSLEISGIVLSETGGKILVDVHDVRAGFEGPLPEQPLMVASKVFEKMRIYNNFAVFTDAHLRPVYPVFKAPAAASNTSAVDGDAPSGQEVASGSRATVPRDPRLRAPAAGRSAPARPRTARAVRGVGRGDGGRHGEVIAARDVNVVSA